jgi:preprotein translocase subunit SecG
MLRTSLMVFHVLLAVFLVVAILVQRGKGAEVGTAFGAGASGTVFGARGSASFLTRATAIMATLFFVTSLSLAFLSSRPTAPTSILDEPVTERSTLPPPPAADPVPASGSTAPSTEPAPADGDAAPATGEAQQTTPPEAGASDAQDEGEAPPEQ